MKQEKNQEVEKIIAKAKFFDDFPKPGMKFFDIFPLVGDPTALESIINIFAERLKNVNYDHIYMLESRGFLFAVPLSLKVNKPVHPFRKKGKLPGPLGRIEYDLEYGSDIIEIQKNIIKQGERVIIVDDVLATGGTMNAAIKLIQQEGGIVEQVMLVGVFEKMNGIEKLAIEKEKVFYILDV